MILTGALTSIPEYHTNQKDYLPEEKKQMPQPKKAKFPTGMTESDKFIHDVLGLTIGEHKSPTMT